MWRKKPKTPKLEPAMVEMRNQALDLSPGDVGIEVPKASGEPWGGLMEIGMSGGVASIVCLKDGTTSLYLNTGGGVIGGGAHETVVSANEAFLKSLTPPLPELKPLAAPPPYPADGQVQFIVLTPEGRASALVGEAELQAGSNPLSPAYGAGHDVITQLRLTAPPA